MRQRVKGKPGRRTTRVWWQQRSNPNCQKVIGGKKCTHSQLEDLRRGDVLIKGPFTKTDTFTAGKVHVSNFTLIFLLKGLFIFESFKDLNTFPPYTLLIDLKRMHLGEAL